MIRFCKRFNRQTIFRLIHDHALLKEATIHVFFFHFLTLLLEFEGTYRLSARLNHQLNVRKRVGTLGADLDGTCYAYDICMRLL